MKQLLLEWTFVMIPWKCPLCLIYNEPEYHSCRYCGTIQQTEAFKAMCRRKGSKDEWKE
jgi:hypothetical protein